MTTQTLMYQEACSTPEKVAQQLKQNMAIWHEIAQRLKQAPPPFCATVARGSSDHAASFAQYLIETQLGWVTASQAPSVITTYHSQLNWKGALVIGISQSGKGPDLCQTFAAAKAAGALTVALVNVEASPLAEIAEYVVPLHAGPEHAVAATKSYITALSALVQFMSIASDDQALAQALAQLPDVLAQSLTMDWSIAVDELAHAVNALVIGRGYGFPIAQEAALKFKETAVLHAEAFSSAEVLHGPFALMQPDFPVLHFLQQDASLTDSLAVTARMTELGANTLLAVPEGLIADSTCAARHCLPLPSSVHPILDPLMAIQAFYVMAEKLACVRGYNPDQPQNLKKVTETR